MSLLKQNQRTIREYRKAGQPWPASAKDIAEWAINNGKWQMQTAAVVKRCAEDMAAAMREEYYTDPEGCRVRLYHPARIKKQGELFTEWDDIRSASRSHMQLSFQQHRRKIAGECRQRQLKADIGSYNSTHSDEQPIQISFNFEMDILELKAADAA